MIQLDKPDLMSISLIALIVMVLVCVTPAQAGFPEYPHPNAAVYQAEQALLSGGARVASNHSGYTGTGFVCGYDFSGTAATTFRVNVPESGAYYISLRYSAGKVGGWPDDRVVGLSVNGGNIIHVNCKSTDTWNEWAEVIHKVELNAGENIIAYRALTPNDNSDSINLDRLSVWPHSDNPVLDVLAFNPGSYSVSVDGSVQTQLYGVNSNGIQVEFTGPVIYTSADQSIVTIDEAGVITGISAGTATIKASTETLSGAAVVNVIANPKITVDFAAVERPVDPSMFGYILTPNYDVPDSRMTLLGPLLNRETIPAQNFQAIGDLDASYYAFEGSILQRSLEAYNRAKEAGMKWYFLLGHNPSWATASGGPVDVWEKRDIKTSEQRARFKQYIKDVLQYFKDHGAEIDFANLTNEYWTGLELTLKAVWEAVREVYPDPIPTVGPGAVGFRGIPDFNIPFASENQITLEGPCWHEFWTADTFAPLSQVQGWKNTIARLQERYPETNGKYIIWEENNSGGVNAGGPTGSAVDFTRSMANVIRAGVTHNIKGCLEAHNWNGMSDLMTTKKLEVTQNPAVRRPLWWVYYAFSKMSGHYVAVSTDSSEEFTAAACMDSYESKIIFAKDDIPGSVDIVLNNQPYSGQDIKIDLYKIVPIENDGLKYQTSIVLDGASEASFSFSVNNVGANETWLVVIKKKDAPPSFFHPMTPDDGEVALPTPTLTWSEAQDAESYTVVVSTSKDLSDPVIYQSGIRGTSYTIETPLTVGQKYYWSVIAVNQHGSTPVANNAVYSFIVGNNTNVPGQFGPHLPTLNAPNEPIRPEFRWSPAYNATSYRLVVSKNPDLSDPVINQAGITTVRNTGHFGPRSQAFYRPTASLEYDTKYYWTVYAVNEHGERPMNGPLRYFTTKAEGNSPTSFNLIAPADGEQNVSARAVLSWEPSKNAFFYKLEVSSNPDMSDPVIVRDRMIYHRYTVEPNLLQPNTTYYWRVTAYTKNLVHSTAASDGEIRSFTTEAVPCSPLLYAVQPGDGAVKLWFRLIDGADSYKILYGTSSGAYEHVIADVKASPFTVTGLNNDTVYYFAVAAVNSSGDSSVWNELTAVPMK